jgi:hypothetical protein
MREGTAQPGKRLLVASEKYGELGGDLIFCRGYNASPLSYIYHVYIS